MRWACLAVATAALFGASALAETPAPATVSLDAVRQEMVGTWQSSADTRFTREFDADGRAFDRMLGADDDLVPASWRLFAGTAPPGRFASLKLDAKGVYLEIDRPDDMQLFKLVSVSSSDLQMIDMGQRVLVEYLRLK